MSNIEPASSATQTASVPALRAILSAPTTNLAKRFRALFSLKHLGSQGDEDAIDAIAAAFETDSALLKHEWVSSIRWTRWDEMR